MGIVRFALRLPHTFYVLAALILFLGVDGHPVDADRHLSRDRHSGRHGDLDYTGLRTPEMEQRVTTYSEYRDRASVNGIRDIRSQTLNGVSVQKIFFQPDVNLDLAISQIVAGTNSIRGCMPPESRRRSSSSTTPRACQCCRSA